MSNEPQMALQYENGNLAIRPINPDVDFENQKWITSTTKITRSIPALNYGPASLFTAEFNPYAGSATSTSSSSLNQQNNQQVTDVINLIKSNIKQYIDTVSNNQSSTGYIQPTSSSSLGNKDMPLNINVNLGTGKSSFADITGTTTKTDLLSLLDKYEKVQTGSVSPNMLYTGTDLQTALQTVGGCSSVNIDDYTSNRVSTCNCKL
jgi:hypothetical protein